ncbi:MAG: carboxypeptidase-like regulatory domain-containing protein, partial [Bacteroidetes bacterium]|nr:carboxypeptidase-like regulatory domain-containing protein [Bacteroidota bacterium]
SDSTGHYSFKTTETGAHIITASSIGYKPFEQPITIDKQSITLNIVLKEELSELKAVTVIAGSFAAGDSKRGAVLNSIDIATTAGSNADITAALKTLPGTQQVGEQEGLFVRGGAGYEAKQYIDGTLVANPYYTSVPDISTRGRFSPFLFKGTVFSTGGYSALYGQALSSVLLLESIDLPEKSEIDASISPLFWGLGTQQLAKNKKWSYGINYGYTNVGLYFKAVKQTPDYFTMPAFHNVDANFRFKTKRGGMVKYYTSFSYSQLGLRRADIDSAYLKNAFGLTNHNYYQNISWREYLGKGWKMNLSAGYSTNRDDISNQLQDAQNQPKVYNSSVYWMYNKAFTALNRQDLAQAKAVFEKRLGGISSIRFGSEYWYGYNTGKFNDTLRKLTDNYNALFAETDVFITNDLAAKLGARLENSSVINKANVAPRISLAYKTGRDAQVSFAYGIFYQKAENTQLYYTTNLDYTKATHYIVNYQKMTNDRIFRVEAYYKNYASLIRTVPVNNYYSTFTNGGSGYAQGFELFWRDKKSIKDFDYWISYSYLDTKREYLNYPEKLTPNFAATHTASLVMKRFVTKIKSGFNLTYSYA